MRKCRYIAQSFLSCIRRWKSAPRILILFGFIACLTIVYALPMAENARAQGTALQCAEVFIALMNWRFAMLVFSTIALLLYGDLPFIEPSTLNAIIRGTRQRWMLSQIVYICFTSAILCLVIFMISALIAAPNIDVSNAWSRSIRLLTSSGRIAINPERMRLSMPIEIVTTFAPWQAFGHSITLFYLLCCIYGLGSLVLGMRYRSGGFVLLLAANALSWATGMFYFSSVGYSIVSYLSLHYHASLHEHFKHNVNALAPSLSASYAILLCGISALTLLAMRLVKRYDFFVMEDDPG